MRHSENYCPTCKKECKTAVRAKRGFYTIKGVTVSVMSSTRFCLECQNEIPDVKLDNETRLKANEEYKRLTGLYLSKELIDVRKGYGFTIDQFAKVIGLDTKLLREYEHGEIQPECVDNLVKLCYDEANFVFLWHRACHKFSKQVTEKLEIKFPIGVRELIISSKEEA